MALESDHLSLSLSPREKILSLTYFQPHWEICSVCAYCRRHADKTRCSYGGMAHRILPEHYECLMERGWIRSGRYVYQPINSKTCCANIPIRLDAIKFDGSKRHKRVLKRMQGYLRGSRQVWPHAKPLAALLTFCARRGNVEPSIDASSYENNPVIDLCNKALSCMMSDLCSTSSNYGANLPVEAVHAWSRNIRGSMEDHIGCHLPSIALETKQVVACSTLPLQIMAIQERDSQLSVLDFGKLLERLSATLARAFATTRYSQYLTIEVESSCCLNIRFTNSGINIGPNNRERACRLLNASPSHVDISVKTNTYLSEGQPSDHGISEVDEYLSGETIHAMRLMYKFTGEQAHYLSKCSRQSSHRLEVKIVRPHYTEEHHELYLRYNHEIHGIPIDELTKGHFVKHIVDSPITYTRAVLQPSMCSANREDRYFLSHWPLNLSPARQDTKQSLKWHGKDLLFDVETSEPMLYDEWVILTATAHAEVLLAMQETFTSSYTTQSDSLQQARDSLAMVFEDHGIAGQQDLISLLRIYNTDMRCPSVETLAQMEKNHGLALQRFYFLRSVYCSRLLTLLPESATADVVRAAWDQLYVADSLRMPSVHEFTSACFKLIPVLQLHQRSLESLEHDFYKKQDRIVRASDNFLTAAGSGYKLLHEHFQRDSDYRSADQIARVEGWDLQIGYGSFFQEYRLDGRLVCVSLIDILPSRLSSVYCFYNPDLRHMEWGKYSALREIYWVQRAVKYSPILKYVDMNFYVHDCGQMNYKSSFEPSELKCLHTNTWVPLRDVVDRLDADPKAPLVDSCASSPELDPMSNAYKAHIGMLIQHCCIDTARIPTMKFLACKSPDGYRIEFGEEAIGEYVTFSDVTPTTQALIYPDMVNWVLHAGVYVGCNAIIDCRGLLHCAKKRAEDELKASNENASIPEAS